MNVERIAGLIAEYLVKGGIRIDAMTVRAALDRVIAYGCRCYECHRDIAGDGGIEIPDLDIERIVDEAIAWNVAKTFRKRWTEDHRLSGECTKAPLAADLVSFWAPRTSRPGDLSPDIERPFDGGEVG